MAQSDLGDLVERMNGITIYSPPLEPEAWFGEGHQPGVHVWAPAPAAAHEALKQLSKSRLKRMSTTTHVFICPRLLYQEEWRKRFEKEMDIWFTLYPGTVWTNHFFPTKQDLPVAGQARTTEGGGNWPLLVVVVQI